MTKQDRLNELFKKYNLSKEDYFKSPQGWTIITRSGIDAIQAGANIGVSYDVITMERDFVVIKAIAGVDGRTVESFGEALVGKYPVGNTKSNYPVAIAEKRAMARVVLKLAGFYQLGAFSEDESEDFKDERVEINTKQLSQMKDGIIRGEYTADEAFAKAEGAGLLIPESLKYTYRKLKVKDQLTHEIKNAGKNIMDPLNEALNEPAKKIS